MLANTSKITLHYYSGESTLIIGIVDVDVGVNYKYSGLAFLKYKQSYECIPVAECGKWHLEVCTRKAGVYLLTTLVVVHFVIFIYRLRVSEQALGEIPFRWWMIQ